jgi:hypothetical protein
MATTFSVDLFSFNELSPESQGEAIENYRKGLENGNYGSDDFPRWAIDDCSLFEPKHEEMVKLFGETYYIDNKEQFVFKNNRDGIEFNCDAPYRHLSFHNALEITNDKMFLLFLGIPEKFHGHLSYNFFNDDHRYPDTKIEFEINDLEELGEEDQKNLETIIPLAENKFDEHRENILEKISDDIEYRYSDESIREDLENKEDMEFTLEGKIWKIKNL